MRFIPLVVALFGVLVYASTSNNVKSYILTLEENQSTLQAKIDDLKSLVKQAGGKITHEYSLIQGFSMELPAKHSSTIVEKIEQLGKKLKCKFSLEPDQEVHAFEGPEEFKF